MHFGNPGQSEQPERPRRSTGTRLTLAAILALGAFAGRAHATGSEMTQEGAKTPSKAAAPTPGPGKLSAGILAKVLQADRNLSKAAPRDTHLDMARALNGTDDSMTQWRAQLESNPDSAEAIRSAGMTPKEFLRDYTTIVQAAAVSNARQSGSPIPDRIKKQVAEADVTFVEAHRAEIGQMARPGAANMTPNTMEDIYVADDTAGKPAQGAESAKPADPSAADASAKDKKKKKAVKP